MTVTSVANENPKKLEVSISVPSSCYKDTLEHRRARLSSSDTANTAKDESNIIDSIFPKKKAKTNSLFSWASSPKSSGVKGNSLDSSHNQSTTASVSPKLVRHATGSADSDSVKSAPVCLASPFFHSADHNDDPTTASLVYSKTASNFVNYEAIEPYSPSMIRFV